MNFLIILHSLLRWVILILMLFAAIRSLIGWFKKENCSTLDNRIYLFLMVTMHVQLLAGIAVYVLSPVIHHAFNDFGAAMRNAELRFFSVEHPMMMIIAIVLVTIGKIYAGKIAFTSTVHKRIAMFYIPAFLIVLYGTPWPFSAVPRTLFP